MRTGYIYGLICPIKKHILYIGQTVRTLDKRLLKHKKDNLKFKGRLNKKESWLRSLYKKNLIEQIKIVEIEKCNEEQLDEREIFWIAHYRKLYDDLKNSSDGGEGMRLRGENHPLWGKHRSEITKQKISFANKGEKNGMFGKRFKKTKKQIENLKIGLKNSEKFKKSRANPLWRAKISLIQSKTVYFLDCDFQIVYEFQNLKKASEFIGCTHSNVKHARVDRRLLCKKYWVIYKEDFDNNKNNLKNFYE